jgi:hypothetical protein
MARKYGPQTSKEVEETMHEFKHAGKFKNRRQAIGLKIVESEAEKPVREHSALFARQFSLL